MYSHSTGDTMKSLAAALIVVTFIPMFLLAQKKAIVFVYE